MLQHHILLPTSPALLPDEATTFALLSLVFSAATGRLFSVTQPCVTAASVTNAVMSMLPALERRVACDLRRHTTPPRWLVPTKPEETEFPTLPDLPFHVHVLCQYWVAALRCIAVAHWSLYTDGPLLVYAHDAANAQVMLRISLGEFLSGFRKDIQTTARHAVSLDVDQTDRTALVKSSLHVSMRAVLACACVMSSGTRAYVDAIGGFVPTPGVGTPQLSTVLEAAPLPAALDDALLADVVSVLHDTPQYAVPCSILELLPTRVPTPLVQAVLALALEVPDIVFLAKAALSTYSSSTLACPMRLSPQGALSVYSAWFVAVLSSTAAGVTRQTALVPLTGIVQWVASAANTLELVPAPFTQSLLTIVSEKYHANGLQADDQPLSLQRWSSYVIITLMGAHKMSRAATISDLIRLLLAQPDPLWQFAVATYVLHAASKLPPAMDVASVGMWLVAAPPFSTHQVLESCVVDISQQAFDAWTSALQAFSFTPLSYLQTVEAPPELRPECLLPGRGDGVAALPPFIAVLTCAVQEFMQLCTVFRYGDPSAPPSSRKRGSRASADASALVGRCYPQFAKFATVVFGLVYDVVLEACVVLKDCVLAAASGAAWQHTGPNLQQFLHWLHLLRVSAFTDALPDIVEIRSGTGRMRARLALVASIIQPLMAVTLEPLRDVVRV